MHRILIVDDNPANLRLMTFLLQGNGYDVRGAGDAPTALLALTEHRPDLIIMDLQLPHTDGLQLTRQIKSDPRTAGIIIVAVTAHAMSGDEARARNAGCDGYVAKPIDVRSFPATIAQHLAAKPG
jgi:CheY-like chemotaxis protein